MEVMIEVTTGPMKGKKVPIEMDSHIINSTMSGYALSFRFGRGRQYVWGDRVLILSISTANPNEVVLRDDGSVHELHSRTTKRVRSSGTKSGKD